MRKRNKAWGKDEFLAMSSECTTGTELADKLNISRERVRQLAVKFGVTKWKRIAKIQTYCSICGNPKHYKSKTCCSKECQGQWLTLQGNKKNSPVKRICETCGNIFYRKPYLIREKSPARFCSEKCRGVYVGNMYGLGAHPPKRKYNYEYLYWLYDKAGLTGSEISALVGISKYYIYAVIRKVRKGKDDGKK